MDYLTPDLDFFTSLYAELHQLIKSYLPLKSLYSLCLTSKSLLIYGFESKSFALDHLHQNLLNELRHELCEDLIAMITDLDMIISGSFILSIALFESYDNSDIDIYMDCTYDSHLLTPYLHLFDIDDTITENCESSYYFDAKYIGKTFSGKKIQLISCPNSRTNCISESDISFCKNFFSMNEIYVLNLYDLLNKEGTIFVSRNKGSFKKRCEKYIQRGFTFTNVNSLSNIASKTNEYILQQLIDNFGLQIITYGYDKSKYYCPKNSNIKKIFFSADRNPILRITIDNICPKSCYQQISKNDETNPIQKDCDFFDISDYVTKSSNHLMRIPGGVSFEKCSDCGCILNWIGCDIEHFHLYNDSRSIIINDDTISDNLREKLDIVDIENYRIDDSDYDYDFFDYDY